MSVFTRVTAYPPLGQITVVPPSRKQFNFTVVIESSQPLLDRPWDVSVWYDHGSYSQTTATWKALDLERVVTGPTVLYDERSSQVNRYTFEGCLPSPFPDNAKTYRGRKIPFTIRYRTDSSSEWEWVGDHFGLSDGFVILQPPVDPNYLGAGPVELREGWHARKTQSEAPGARLYTIETSLPIPPNLQSESGVEDRTLGHVILPCRWFALVRVQEPWLAPRHGHEFLHLDKPAILLSFLRADGQHVVLLAVNGIDDCVTTFSSDEGGHIVCSAKNDTGKERKLRILAAMAWSFEIANAAVMYEMRKLVVQSGAHQETFRMLNGLNLQNKEASGDPVHVSHNHVDQARHELNGRRGAEAQWQQAWYDHLAYCTWNSLGQDLHIDKIVKALRSLAEHDIRVTTLIIDDNWQSLTGTQGETPQLKRAWTAFEANSTGFPDGLKAAVDRIREEHPYIQDIAVWHALFGYWGCVSAEEGHIKDNYKIREVRICQQSFGKHKKHVVDPSDIHRMYDDFYSFLSQCGITSVKADAQCFLDLLSDTKDRREMIVPYQSAWTQAHLRHLGGRAISCMSQIPQILYHSLLPTNTSRIILRNSDDFFPDAEKSHAWHVFSNAHASLFTQHLNVIPDWDMFQTLHAWGGYHAAARCISGGPIYITDIPGEHDIGLVQEMTAKTTKGETVVLRPSLVGKSLSVYDGYDEGAILKVGSYDGRSETGTGLMAIFNTSEVERAFVVPADKIPGVVAVEVDLDGDRQTQHVGRRRWIVRSHMSKKITAPVAPTIPPRGDALLEATLAQRGYDVWSALPVHGPYPLAAGESDFAVVGLLGKMTGACAIVASRFTLRPGSGGLDVHVQLKALGVLGIWVSDGTARDVGDLMVTINAEAVPQEHVKYSTEGTEGSNAAVLEIDVVRAWRDMQLEASWSGEVGVQVYFR